MNNCEHCAEVAPDGRRFCSPECARCEVDSSSESGCDSICRARATAVGDPVTPCTCITAHDRMVCVGWCDPPYVCSGCYAVGEEPHLSWCIDDALEREHRHAIETGDYDRTEEEDD